MGRLLPRIVMGVALGVAVFATAMGLIDRWDGPSALASLAVAAAAVGGLLRVASRRGWLVLPPGASAPRFVLRAARWTLGVFVLLAPSFWVVGVRYVAATWPAPEHSQAGLFALLMALWYGGTWAPAAGAWLAWHATPRPGEEAG
jgi:hypothetical protein